MRFLSVPALTELPSSEQAVPALTGPYLLERDALSAPAQIAHGDVIAVEDGRNHDGAEQRGGQKALRQRIVGKGKNQG